MRIMKKISSFVESVENLGNFKSWILYVIAIMLIRNGMESFISVGKYFRAELFFAEYIVFYLIGFLIAADVERDVLRIVASPVIHARYHHCCRVDGRIVRDG